MRRLHYAYADESGDPGYAFSENSSPRFVLGVILPEQPEQLIDRLLALRRALGKPATFEFRYHQANAGIRQAFFDLLRDEPVALLVAVIHKQYAPADFRRLGRSGIYSHALAGLALRAPVKLTDYKLHLDGSGKQRQFLQGPKAQVRWACRVANRPEQSWEDIRLLDSSHPLIQCADMITGAVADHANHNDEHWLAAISAQMAVLWHERFETDGEKRNSLD
jgi:hypothetical protein